MRKMPQTPWKTDAAVIVSLDNKWYAWRPAPCREDRTRWYEMANRSMAVVPSSPCNVRGPSQQRRRSEILWRGIGVVGLANL